MADFAPLIAAVPLVVIERSPVGFTVRTWRSPLVGWTPLSEVEHFPDVHGAVQEQTRRLFDEGGATVSLPLEPFIFRLCGGAGND